MGIHFREPDDFTQLLEITPQTRRAIAATIDRLIDLLDRFEGEADDEPDLGAPEPILPDDIYFVRCSRVALDQRRWAQDRDGETDDDADEADEEELCK